MSAAGTVQAGTATVSLQWDHAIVDKMIPGLEKALTRAAFRVAETARNSLGRNHGGIPSKPGNPPHTQSPAGLSQRITHASPEQLGKKLTAAAGTNLFYGRVLEFGKVIRAKGKLLVIPLNKPARLLLRRSVTGRAALDAMKAKYGKGVSKVKTREGGIMIGVVPMRKAKVRLGHGYKFLESAPIFLLSKKATIAPRPWLRPALNRTDVALIVGTVATQEWRAKGLVK